MLTDLYPVPVGSQRFSVLTHLGRPHAERVNVEAANEMGPSVSSDFDLEAAFVMLLFTAGVELAAAALSQQTADTLHLSFGAPLPPLVNRVAHGGHRN